MPNNIKIKNKEISHYLIKIAFQILGLLIVFAPNFVFAQEESFENKTDVSMFYKNDGMYIVEAESSDGNLWNQMGHHGPAIENLWAGYRIYFDKKAAIDIYNKAVPRLELKKTKWYTLDSLKKKNYGIDTYWVGNSIGVGSIRLWDGDSVRMLDPVSNRRAIIKKEASISQIDVISEGIPYKDKQVDILVRMTVFSNFRYAKVEAFVLSEENVQLVTGLNFNPDLEVAKNKDNTISWGNHDSKTKIKVGAAIIYQDEDFNKKLDKKGEYLLISKPTKYLCLWITTASNMEEDINDWEKFQKYVQELTQSLLSSPFKLESD